MCPLYVVHVGGGEGSSAVEAESHAVELASHIGDIFFGGDAWVLAGLPFDAIHAAGNVLAGLLIVPLAELLQKLSRTIQRGK